ncbi:MAG: DUF3341 domain-containing protein [Nitrospirota bacterium]|jgi:molybdopterin-containing oxidoreductase family membrane subunit
MKGTARVTAMFAEEEPCAGAIAASRAAGFAVARVFSPFASERLAEALGARRSPVRLWVLLGGITGCLGGFVLTIGLSTLYPHRTAGMPIVSIPPFVIIAFELTILCGALSGVLGFLVHGRFASREPVAGYRVEFTNDRFGVVVECAAAEAIRVEEVLRGAGATEVSHESV